MFRGGHECQPRGGRLGVVGAHHRTLPVERVEPVAEFAGVCGDAVGFEVGGGVLDDPREARDGPEQVPLGPGRQPRDVRGWFGVVGLVQDTTAAGVDVLDVGGRLGLEVQRPVPLEGNTLGRLLGDDVVADGADADLSGDAVDVVGRQLVVPEPAATTSFPSSRPRASPSSGTGRWTSRPSRPPTSSTSTPAAVVS